MVKTEARGNKTTFVTSLFLWGNKVSIRLPADFLPTWEAGKKLAEDEGSSVSKLFERAFEDLVIKRGLEAKDSKLDPFIQSEKYRTYPNPYLKWKPEDLTSCSSHDLEEMEEILSHNAGFLKSDLKAKNLEPANDLLLDKARSKIILDSLGKITETDFLSERKTNFLHKDIHKIVAFETKKGYFGYCPTCSVAIALAERDVP
ncbi:MAG: hypothetical protein ACRDF4_08700 [Rhabdochlamydiaceae bacterium]